ncbi:MAG: hypothetical protein Q8P25_02945 [Candidatus Curtissbacteria bacterium]|nr:hypothetical protein [Candidatus Curtissbacteria bacterium]
MGYIEFQPKKGIVIGFGAEKGSIGFAVETGPRNFELGYLPPTRNIRLPFHRRFILEAKKNLVGLMIDTEVLSSANGSVWAILGNDLFSPELKMRFTPSGRELENNSLTGRKKKFLSWFEQYNDFLQKWERNKKLKVLQKITGFTSPKMANFAVRHLGFEYEWGYGPKSKRGVGIRGSRPKLIEKMCELEQSGIFKEVS